MRFSYRFLLYHQPSANATQESKDDEGKERKKFFLSENLSSHLVGRTKRKREVTKNLIFLK